MGSFSPDLSTTGQPQTGFTSPVYTLQTDLYPDSNGRQWVITAIGGTQTGVRVHTNGDPFTVAIRKDKAYKALPAKNPTNGTYPNVPLNKIEVLGRKGVYIDSANTVRNMNLRVIAEIPAGSEVADPANIRALLSMVLGTLVEESADFGDSLISGVI